MSCSSKLFTISLFKTLPWQYAYKTEKKTLSIFPTGVSMVVPVARMNIHHNVLISSLYVVYSTGYGIGTVFPFAL